MIAVLHTLVAAVAQLVLLVALAPGVNGVIKQLKARLQNRRGPSVLQGYFDLWKYLRKDSVRSEHRSWISSAAPPIYAGAFGTAALLVPAIWLPAPLAGWGDAIVLIGLFALARFFLALAGLDTGSAFGGMGSSREVAISALAEPVLLLALFAVALLTGGTNLSAIAAALSARGFAAVTPGQLLALVAMLIVVLAETGRVPVDNPDTHLELTMVHEGMLLEYSGRPLGILIWATLLKQTVIYSLLAAVFFPWGIASDAALPSLALGLGVYLLKLLLLCALMAVVESAFAKLRIFKVPDLMGAGLSIALLAVIANGALR
jgi:formate hydrogenlyase subunit 4